MWNVQLEFSSGDLKHLQAASRSSKKKQKKKNASNQTRNTADDLDYEKMLNKLKQKLEVAKSQNVILKMIGFLIYYLTSNFFLSLL